MKKSLTTEQLAEAAIKAVEKMSPKEKLKLRRELKKRYLPRQYSIGDTLSYLHSDGGMRRAARRVAYEDRQLKLFTEMGSEGLVN
ncbi:MAG TPA: hypothetical protein VIX91_15005 [Candidatus Acidoferrum sp.]